MPEILRVYLDTSIYGGVEDEEFRLHSELVFERARKKEFMVLYSSVVAQELFSAPRSVQLVFASLREARIEQVALDPRVRRLADAYIEEGVLKQEYLEDALHVAAATMAGADLILSWNFKHLVRFESVRGFNRVNAKMGLGEIDIRSPREFSREDKDI